MLVLLAWEIDRCGNDPGGYEDEKSWVGILLRLLRSLRPLNLVYLGLSLQFFAGFGDACG